MITGVYNAYNNANLLKSYFNKQNCSSFGNNNDKTVSASIFYVNDLHGQNIRMEKLINAINQFDTFTPSNKDKMKFASGDIMLGEDEKHVKVDNKFLNLGGFLATALGNHECDLPTNQFAQIIKDKKYKILGLNMNPSEINPIRPLIEKSYIQEINGHKYGIIGLVAPDLHIHVKLQEHLPDLHVEQDLKKSIPEIQKQVDEFEKQGINKIIILSHAGYRQDVEIAKNIKGVDIILGAHTHNLLENIKENENLFYSKTGEPIIITQAGRDGEHFGVLNVDFNENGIITKVQNNIGDTDKYSRNMVARDIFENILGKPEKVGYIKSAQPYPKDFLGSENPHCDFIMDALRSELNTDIAFMNSANIRGKFEPGDIDTRDLSIISPFANKVVISRATEEEIVNAIKSRTKASMKTKSHRPGLVQVSGLKYTFNSAGEVLSITFIDKNGKETPIDINNPRKDKFYKICSDDYCLGSEEMGLGLPHRLKEAEKIFDHDKDIVVGEYIKHLNKPIEIKGDGRITKVD